VCACAKRISPIIPFLFRSVRTRQKRISSKMYSDGHEVDGSWVLRVYVTDLQVERSLRVKGELHIGGVMLRLVEDLGECDNVRLLSSVLFTSFYFRLLSTPRPSLLPFVRLSGNFCIPLACSCMRIDMKYDCLNIYNLTFASNMRISIIR